MNADKPLDGKRIVVTRTIDQARDLKDRLEKLGAEVLLLPAVSFSECAVASELDEAIASLSTYHWILFTSANAVRFFANRCRRLGAKIGTGGDLCCGVVGPATASAAAAEGFAIDYVAGQFVGVALAREMGPTLARKKVLLPRSDRAGRDLPDELRKIGAEVTEVVAYHTGGIGTAEPVVLEAVRAARVDAISFFSQSAVENLCGELGEEILSQLAVSTVFAAVGPVTAAALRKANLPVAIIAENASGQSMAAAIAKYFSAHGMPEMRPLCLFP